MLFANWIDPSRWGGRIRTSAAGRNRRAGCAATRLVRTEVLEARTLLTAFGVPQQISSDTDGAFSVRASDLDGDGDQDVLSASLADDTIAWYENLGNGVFGAQQLISTVADGAVCVETVDLDGDADPDVLVASMSDDTIAWYENQGNGVFGARRIISSTADSAACVSTADVDGDGDQDVLSASYLDDTVAWYENQGGGTFGGQQVISTAADGVVSVTSADVDGDGDPDVLSASYLDDTIAWYENQGGGVFSAQRVISTASDGTVCVNTADLDGDGDVDVLSASYLDDSIAWYENQGGGAFAGRQVLTTAADGANSVHTADLDGDGDFDVLSASIRDDTVAWYENQGQGVFGARRIITDTADGAQHVSTSDLDGDSDPDVLAALKFADAIVWFEQNATPTLDAIADRTLNENAAAHTLDLQGIGDGSSEGGAVRVSAVSSDASKVQVTTLDYSSPSATGTLTLTPALNALGTATITVTVEDSGFDGELSTQADNATFRRSFAVQLAIPRPVWEAPLGTEADQTPELQWSNIDVLADSDGADHYELWINNLSTGQDKSLHETQVVGHRFAPKQFSEGQQIAANSDGAVAVHVADLDGDGDPDVLAASMDDDTVAWYPNQGAGVFADRRVITATARGARSVFSADLDGDGDLDVLAASRDDDTISWFPNQGGGVFGTQQVINPVASGASCVYAEDLDGDGDLDVLAAAMDENTVAWYENRGGGVFGAGQVITALAQRVVCVYAVDLDADGDLDVLAASSLDDSITWYANQGSGVFGSRQVIGSSADGAWSVTTADLDGDGDPDVLASSREDDTVAWYENQGSGVFGSRQVITAQSSDATSVAAADLDGDGDPDVVATSYADNTVSWYENSGDGVFGTQQVISSAYEGTVFVSTADLDGDGDPDVVSAAVRDDALVWYENTTSQLGLGRFAAWVRAFDSQGRSGPWSDVGKFRISAAPRFSLPAAATGDPTPTLSWNTVAGASRYELWVDDIDRGRSQVIRQTELSTSNFTPSNRLSFGRYRAWVRAFDIEDRPTPWSAARTFRIQTAPQFTNDIQNTPNPRPQLRWNAAAEVDHYELWIRGLGRNPDPYIHETQLTSTQFTFAADLPIGTYYAWVRGVYGDDSATPWSAADHFRVVTSPVITGPLGRTADRTPAFSWQGVVGADHYELWVNNTSTGQSRLIHETDITSTDFVPATDIPTGAYRAWVRGVDLQGLSARWSACHMFVVTVDTPAIVAPQGTVSGAPIVFEWTAVADASRFELWVRNMTTGQDRVIHDTNLTSTQHTHNEQLSAGDYRIWVRAFDANGIAGEWISGGFQVAGQPLPGESTSDQNSALQDLLLPVTESAESGALERVAATDMLPRPLQARSRSALAERTRTYEPSRSSDADTQAVRRRPEESGERPRGPALSETQRALIDQVLQEWPEVRFDRLSDRRVASSSASS